MNKYQKEVCKEAFLIFLNHDELSLRKAKIIARKQIKNEYKLFQFGYGSIRDKSGKEVFSFKCVLR
ncbi:TPA: hypothetical protein PTV74_003144 [Clostridium botulinum]|nr:hypothetical protein [Clostridium botulinum]HDK7206299.1 hypothetical protein [Clostridium botulinum]HDK7210035.1 hypothetical protein [Clostridium botulinum]HDK7265484.1 hypothetical protein [Clostridium botulinum]HDK7269332.1 hypothetical protein [Clostridium botulinum]